MSGKKIIDGLNEALAHARGETMTDEQVEATKAAPPSFEAAGTLLPPFLVIYEATPAMTGPDQTTAAADHSAAPPDASGCTPSQGCAGEGEN
jgi:hypothetical protein